MIFVTLGSQKFQFDRLLKKLDELIDNGVIADKVFAQIGYSQYHPVNFEYREFMDRDEFAQKIADSDMVITHGGTGVIINAVKKGKKVVAVPRLAKYGEHVDDHQIQLLQQFEELNLIASCYELEQLAERIKFANETQFSEYKSNTDRIIEDIEAFIEGMMT